jgi:hypothetical protein
MTISLVWAALRVAEHFCDENYMRHPNALVRGIEDGEILTTEELAAAVRWLEHWHERLGQAANARVLKLVADRMLGRDGYKAPPGRRTIFSDELLLWLGERVQIWHLRFRDEFELRSGRDGWVAFGKHRDALAELGIHSPMSAFDAAVQRVHLETGGDVSESMLRRAAKIRNGEDEPGSDDGPDGVS